MKKNISYKRINSFLLPAMLVFCIITYKLALSRTVDAWSSMNKLSEQAEQQKNAPARIAELKKQIIQFDKLIGNNARDSLETRQDILDKTGQYCSRSGCCLIDFPNPIITDKNTFAVETNSIVLEGTYAKLLQYIYEMETRWRPGKVVSVRFLQKTDMKTNTKTLNAYVYIQKIKKNK
jgi:hypothetical protein